MSIAEQIKDYHTARPSEDGYYDAMTIECEEKAVEIDQDWDNETTTYTFADGSAMVQTTEEFFAYGSAD